MTELGHLYDWDENDPKSTLIVKPGSTYEAEKEKVAFRKIVIGDDASIVITSRAKDWQLDAIALQMGKNVQIVARGKRGQNGSLGDPGSNAGKKCGHGTDGGDGGDGTAGMPGKNIAIRAIELFLPKDGIRIDTSGGDGGNGGIGGRGGDGGRGSRGDSCPGGNGGKGGSGGNAGLGGNGGNLTIRYVTAKLNSERNVEGQEIMHTDVSRMITHISTGGKAGTLGQKGEGGSGGSGRGAGLGPGQAAGSAGSDGKDGKVSRNGMDGGTEIKVVRSSQT